MVDREQIVAVLKAFEIKKASLFGSVARGEEYPNDVDILIEPTAKMGLFEFVDLKNQLYDAVHYEDDLITFCGLHPSLRD